MDDIVSDRARLRAVGVGPVCVTFSTIDAESVCVELCSGKRSLGCRKSGTKGEDTDSRRAQPESGTRTSRRQALLNGIDAPRCKKSKATVVESGREENLSSRESPR